MNVAALYRYPVKSLGGQLLTTAVLEERGIAGDRRFMFVNEDGGFISRRTEPQLAQFSAAITSEGDLQFLRTNTGELLHTLSQRAIRTQRRREVLVWGDVVNAVEVDLPTDLVERMGIPTARLVYMDALSHRAVDSNYTEGERTVSFADGYPYLICNRATIQELSRRLGTTVDAQRFRPNIIVEGPSAGVEDKWEQLTLGSVAFRVVKPCARCIMVDQQPASGERDLSVLGELSHYRRAGNKVLFGVNALLKQATGKLSIGNPLRIGRNRGLPSLLSMLFLCAVAGALLSCTAGVDQLTEQQPPPNMQRIISAGDTFWIDQTEVTTAAFAEFAAATGYITEAEEYGWSGVFDRRAQDWLPVEGADFRYPRGPRTEPADTSEPVTQVSLRDARAFSSWAGKQLPTEAEWMAAATNDYRVTAFPWGEDMLPAGAYLGNWWQGPFPVKDEVADGYAGLAPVAQFPASVNGLYDVSGNVWEWTVTPRTPAGGEYVIKGGSFLCSTSYCTGFNLQEKQFTPSDSGLNHLGFRCIWRPKGRADSSGDSPS